MVYRLTKSEQVVKRWIIEEKDIDRSDIERGFTKTPDFKTPDQNYEAKKLYGTKIIVYDNQVEDISEDDVIVVTDLEEVIETFEWGNRDDASVNVKIVNREDNDTSNTTIAVSEEFAQHLKERYEGDNYEERLKNWAEDYEDDSDGSGFSEAEIRKITQEEIEDRLGVFSDKISEEIEEKFRQMNR